MSYPIDQTPLQSPLSLCHLFKSPSTSVGAGAHDRPYSQLELEPPVLLVGLVTIFVVLAVFTVANVVLLPTDTVLWGAAFAHELELGLAITPPTLHCFGATTANNLPKSGVPTPVAASQPVTALKPALEIVLPLLQPDEVPEVMSLNAAVLL